MFYRKKTVRKIIKKVFKEESNFREGYKNEDYFWKGYDLAMNVLYTRLMKEVDGEWYARWDD